MVCPSHPPDMNQTASIELKRDCAAVQIPAGTTGTLPAGTTVHVTQTLGGSYTVQAPGGLFRIAPADADALGFDPPELADAAPPVSGAVDDQLVWDTLRTCFDPEIPVNIVDLGLVYDMELTPHPGGGSHVNVKMTLTAPGCGMGPAIAGDAQVKLVNLPGIEDAQVDIVWDPPWHHSMITEQGRKILGLE
jgi:probable FeS assembly SUF system protein SufT